MDPASRVVVIKIGTSSLLRPDLSSINLSSLARICEIVKELRTLGHKVVLVSSGAIGVGCHTMGLTKRPPTVAQRQAVAAVGQIHLMHYYQEFFQALGLTCAQVLLTLNNLSDRGPYLNARNTFQELLAYDTVPIVNENDTIAVEEIRFGDNDTLSSQVATLVKADWLFLLTDVDGLYTANPATHPEALHIPEVHDITKLQVDTSGDSQWGTGGMGTKLTAARIATAAGCTTVICASTRPQLIPTIMLGKQTGAGGGTVFWPLPNAVRDRKRWILSVPVKGELWLDSGAVSAVKNHRKSLFAAGILKVTGGFAAQDALVLCDASGYEFARGLCNYSQQEVLTVQGKSSKTFKDELGYVGSEEIIHRNNICLLSIVQSLDTDANQDGTPDPTPDEPSPMTVPPPAYSSMSNQAGIPGLTNQGWPQEQQNPGFQHDSYLPASLPVQSQAGSSAAQVGFGANSDMHWEHQQQPQHYGGNSQSEHQVAGHLGPAAPHSGPQGGLAPRLHHQPGHQQGWLGTSGGNTPSGSVGVKQEPGPPHAFGAMPHRHPNTGSTPTAPTPTSSYASSPMPFGAKGSLLPQDPQHAPHDQHPAMAPPSTGFPPFTTFPPGSTAIGTGVGPHNPPQAYQGLPNQANGALSSQRHTPGYPQQGANPAIAGEQGGRAHGGPAHKKRQFEAGPPRSSSNPRQPSYASGGYGKQGGSVRGRGAGGVQERMRQLQSRGQAHGEDETDWHSDLRTAIAAEQGTDGAMPGGSGPHASGFPPSAAPPWQNADFKPQSAAGAPSNSYGYNSHQPDINEQGWLPR
ncbi:hypothetical protein ABBQ38_001421 [Trebouxia sp. C0009 RCD-2024]